MRNWIARWVASILALFVISLAYPKGIHLDFMGHPASLVIAVVALGLANALIRPIIMLFVWPINCLTFGLLGLVINVLLFWAVGSGFVPGFKVANFQAAVIGSLGMAVLSGAINFVLKDRGDRDNR